MTRHAEADQDPILRAMRQTSFYPHAVHAPVQVIQTHISTVFLSGPFAYKVKRPVQFEFLDFSTLSQRRHYCLLELERNRAYAPALYLEVVPIRFGAHGFSLGEHGKIVEHAVKMRRFDERNLFSHMFVAGRLESDHLVRLGHRLAAIHADAAQDPAKAATYGSRDAVLKVVQENFKTCEPFRGRLFSAEQQQAIEAFCQRITTQQAPLFADRVRDGFVRQCHGDLHLNNVCRYEDEVYPFDCIEFNEAFSIIDILYDAAFMVMDLENRNRSDLAFAFLNAWLERSNDIAGLTLLPFYLNLRAMVRAKVYALMTENTDQNAGDRAEKEAKATHFFDLAYRITLPRPRRVFILCGLSGSGKSTVGAYLGRRTPAIHLRSDALRKHLAGIDCDSKGDAEIYSEAMTRRTYARLAADAARVLDAGFAVILDAKFDRREQRAQARAAVTHFGVPVTLVHCHAKREVLITRLNARRNDISDAGADLLEAQQAHWEPFSPEEAHLDLDTEGDWRARLDAHLAATEPTT